LQTECTKEIKGKHVAENVQIVGVNKYGRQNSPIIRVEEGFGECQRIPDIWSYRGDDEH
jgi:hypothetical protein